MVATIGRGMVLGIEKNWGQYTSQSVHSVAPVWPRMGSVAALSAGCSAAMVAATAIAVLLAVLLAVLIAVLIVVLLAALISGW